jgi:hypothetical protein
MTMGAGVRTSNFSQEGVRVCRLRASAKKGKTSLGGRGTQVSDRKLKGTSENYFSGLI